MEIDVFCILTVRVDITDLQAATGSRFEDWLSGDSMFPLQRTIMVPDLLSYPESLIMKIPLWTLQSIQVMPRGAHAESLIRILFSLSTIVVLCIYFIHSKTATEGLLQAAHPPDKAADMLQILDDQFQWSTQTIYKTIYYSTNKAMLVTEPKTKLKTLLLDYSRQKWSSCWIWEKRCLHYNLQTTQLSVKSPLLSDDEDVRCQQGGWESSPVQEKEGVQSENMLWLQTYQREGGA